MKGFLAMYLQIFIELYQRKVPLKRDVILAAIADEEMGYIHGSNFLVEQHRELIEAEYGLTEAGGFTYYFGKYKVYPIQMAEKAVVWLRMRAHGKAGHGSVPLTDNPVVTLSKANEKIWSNQAFSRASQPSVFENVGCSPCTVAVPIKHADWIGTLAQYTQPGFEQY
jgi:acetylornithine deacetylase/succinyl-diaminopimelate desuccinylase-like protein